MANTNFSDEETTESKHKDNYNAKTNYSYLVNNKNQLRENITIKTHQGRFDTTFNPEKDLYEKVWVVTDPINVTFSWKDTNNNTCAFPVSFHMESSKFKTQVNAFLTGFRENKPEWYPYND